MHNEYRIYGGRRGGGYVAGNLIAAFVTGADGNFDAVIKVFSFRTEVDSLYRFLFYTSAAIEIYRRS